MSNLSIYQQSELREAVMKLSVCLGHLDRISSCDAVDDLEDAEVIENERNRIELSLKNLQGLIND